MRLTHMRLIDNFFRSVKAEVGISIRKRVSGRCQKNSRAERLRVERIKRTCGAWNREEGKVGGWRRQGTEVESPAVRRTSWVKSVTSRRVGGCAWKAAGVAGPHIWFLSRVPTPEKNPTDSSRNARGKLKKAGGDHKDTQRLIGTCTQRREYIFRSCTPPCITSELYDESFWL
jgi:hypothetical protein